MVVLALQIPVAGQTDEPVAGATVYRARCVVCHQPNGEGVAGVFPPINETLGNFLAAKAGRDYLANAIVFGLGGTITVGGKRYVGQMKLAPPLSDQEAADVLNFVLTGFNAASLPADAAPYDAAEIAAARGAPMAPTAVAKMRLEVVAELERLGLAR